MKRIIEEFHSVDYRNVKMEACVNNKSITQVKELYYKVEGNGNIHYGGNMRLDFSAIDKLNQEAKNSKMGDILDLTLDIIVEYDTHRRERLKRKLRGVSVMNYGTSDTVSFLFLGVDKLN